MATVTGVNIYIDGVKHNATPQPIFQAAYDISNIKAAGSQFNVQFSYVYDDGGESNLTPIQSFTLLSNSGDSQDPTVPTNLFSTSKTQTTINLAWTASTDNVGVTGYVVYKNGVYEKEVGTTTAQVTGLTAGTQYSFTVSAIDAAGNESAQSNPLVISTNNAVGEPTTSEFISPREGEEIIEGEPLRIKISTIIDEPYVVDVVDYTGANDSEKLAAANEDVTTHGGGTIRFNTRNFLLTEAAIIKSNIDYVIDNCEVRLADATFDNTMRVEGLVPDSANPNDFCKYLFDTKNFSIKGIGVASIKGSTNKLYANNPKTGVNEKWVGDKYGWRTLNLNLIGAKNYEVSGELANKLSISQSSSWSIYNGIGADTGVFRDLDFTTTDPNGDGIDFRYGSKNMTVERITGDTRDDLIAMTNLHGNKWWEYNDNPFPMEPMGEKHIPLADAAIDNITLTDIEGDSGANLIRLLSNGGGKVQNINLTNIRDLQAGDRPIAALITFGKSYGTVGYTAGDINTITINNITNYRANYALEFNDGVVTDNVNADDIKYATGTTALYADGSQTNSTFTNITQI